MSSKDRLKQIKDLLAKKSYAEVVDLCNEHLRSNPNDISVMLGLASAYFGVCQYTEAVAVCNRVLALDPNNIPGLQGALSSQQRLKKYPDIHATLVKLLDVLHSKQQPKSYWLEFKKTLDFYKSHKKYQEAIGMLEVLLKNTQLIYFLRTDPQWKDGPKRLDILKELEWYLEAKEKAEQMGKKESVIDYTRLPSVYTEMLKELQMDDSPLNKVKINNLKLKLINRYFQILQLKQLPKTYKNHSISELKKYAPQLPALSKSYPYDEIYFDFMHFDCNFNEIDSIVEQYHNGKIDIDGKNDSILMNCYRVLQLLQQRPEKALELLSKTKTLLAQRANLYDISVETASSKEAIKFKTENNSSLNLLLLEGIAYFRLNLFNDAFSVLYPRKENIVRLNNRMLNEIFIQLLNEKELYDEAIAFCAMVSEFHLEKAWTLFLMGNLEESFEIYNKSDISKSAIHQYRLGRLYLKLDRSNDALVQFENCTKLDPSMYEPLAYAGKIYLQNQNLKAAIKCLKSSLEKNLDQNFIAVQLLSQIYKSQSKFDDLIQLNKTFIASNPRNLEALRNLAIGCYKTRNINDCISTIHLALRIDFRDAESWELLGECYFREGRYHAALKALERTLEIEPSRPYANLFTAFILDKLKQYAPAIEKLVFLLDDPTVGATALCYLLDVYLDVFNYHINCSCFGRAFSKLEECLQILRQKELPNHYSVWRFLSKLMYYSTVLYPQFPLDLSAVLSKLGGTGYSLVQCINHAIESCTDAKIKAVLCNDLAIYTSDEQAYLMAIELDPQNGDYWNSLGIFYAKTGKFACAMQCFKTALGRNPRNVACWLNFGFVYLIADVKEIALKCFEEAQRLAPLHPLSWTGQYLAGGDEEHMVHCMELSDEYIPELLLLSGKFYFARFMKKAEIKLGSVVDENSELPVGKDDMPWLSKAFAFFSQYLVSNPKSIECLCYLGLVCELMHQFELAQNYFRQAIIQVSNSTDATDETASKKRRSMLNKLDLNLARVLLAQDKFAPSLELFEKCKLSFYDKIVYGTALLNVDKTKALKVFSECYKDAAGKIGLLNYFAKILYKSGNIAIAKQQIASLMKSGLDIGVMQTAVLLSLQDNDKALFDESMNKLMRIKEGSLLFIDAQSFLSKISKVVQRNGILSNNYNEDAQKLHDKSLCTFQIVSLLLDKYSVSKWHALIDCGPSFLKSASVLDPKLGELASIEQDQQFEKLIDLLKTHPHNNLAIRILFRSFGGKYFEKMPEIVALLPLDNLDVECVVDIFCWLLCHSGRPISGPLLRSLLDESQTQLLQTPTVPELYKAFWQFNQTSIHSIESFNQKATKSTETTLLLCAIVHFYALNDGKRALDLLNSIQQPHDEAVTKLFNIISSNK